MRMVLDRDFERVRLTDFWNERRSCFRFAPSFSRGDARIDFDCARRSLRTSRRSSSSSASSAASSVSASASAAFSPSFNSSGGAAASSSTALVSSSTSVVTELSFGMPVANMTRSGSTWNMSPGFSK